MKQIVKRCLSLVLMQCALCAVPCLAQRPFEGVFHCQELDINAELNLYEKDIKVPDALDELCYGFLRGNINGVWAALKVIEMDERKAVVRMASDMGFEAQTIELTAGENGVLTVKLVKDNNMKAVKERKYVKLPKTFELLPIKPLP